jgi:hypothetical protein
MTDDTAFAADVHAEGERRLSAAARKLQRGVEEIVEPVSRFTRERPLAAVGAAFAVGSVIGGGLFTRTTGRLLWLGWRLAGMAMAKNVLANLAGPVGEGP